jgi:integrase
MASVVNDPRGRKRILFFDATGERRPIYLGRMSKRDAHEIKNRVEEIVNAAILGQALERNTAEWVAKIGNPVHVKLAAAGLVAPRDPSDKKQMQLAALLDSYIAGRTDVKPRTRINLVVCRARLVEFFGADKPVDAVTTADAKDWEIWLKKRYAKGTIGRTIKRAKQFFQAAIDRELISKNPFGKIKPPSQVNESRKFFVTLETAQTVLDACPDAEWRLLFALSRFGGLRCPSEHLALTWSDVDWERNRFRVVSSKKEHLEGEGVRWVPIFPELRPYLDEAYDQAPDGARFVIHRYRDGDKNFRTRFMRILRRAGLEPWPKLFQNLRASRETELAEAYPIHVVCAWMGNSSLVAQKHYLQVTEEHFAKAAADSAPDSALNPKTAQNPAHHRARTEHAPNAKAPEKPGLLHESLAFSAAGQYPRQDSNLQPTD